LGSAERRTLAQYLEYTEYGLGEMVRFFGRQRAGRYYPLTIALEYLITTSSGGVKKFAPPEKDGGALFSEPIDP